MLLEIIIPSFNGELHLQKTLDSLAELSSISQSNDILHSLHINGSTDKSNELAQKYTKIISNFEIHQYRDNLGFDQNLLRIITKVKAKYVIFFGDDDLILSRFNIVLEKLRNSEVNWDLIHLNHYFFEEETQLLERDYLDSEVKIENQKPNDFLSRFEARVSALSSNIFNTLIVQKTIQESYEKKSQYLDWIHLNWIYKIVCMQNSRLGQVEIPLIAIRRGNPRWKVNFGSAPLVALNHLIIYRKILKKSFPVRYKKFRNERYKILKFCFIANANLYSRLKYAFKCYREFYLFPTAIIDLFLKILPVKISSFILGCFVKAKSRLNFVSNQ